MLALSYSHSMRTNSHETQSIHSFLKPSYFKGGFVFVHIYIEIYWLTQTCEYNYKAIYLYCYVKWKNFLH